MIHHMGCWVVPSSSWVLFLVMVSPGLVLVFAIAIYFRVAIIIIVVKLWGCGGFE